MEEIPRYLSPESIAIHDYQNGTSVTGRLQNLYVSITERGVKVGNSLCKYGLGDNFQTLTRQSTQTAIERLSDTLHLPIGRGFVSRVDVGINCILQYPLDVYLNHLGRWRGIPGGRQPFGIYYQQKTKKKQLCFYDKVREQKEAGEPIPALYEGKNVLRYEQRFLKGIPAQFGVKELRAETLSAPDFYTKLLSTARDEYLAIEKLNEIRPNFEIMTGKKELYKAGIITLANQYGGKVELIKQIEEAQKRGELSRKQAHDMRGAVNDAFSLNGGLTVESEEMKELTKKIKDAVRYYR